MTANEGLQDRPLKENTMLQEGKPAPKFELQNDQDKTVKLGDYKGQTFVLYFFPRADTPG